MATCERVITLARRKTGEYGAHEPIDGPDLNEGMLSLQSMLDSWVAGGQMGSLVNVLVDEDGEAGEFQRITSTENVTITLPATITEGDDVRAPRDGAYVVVALGEPYQVYIYSAIIADWQEISALALSDEAPLSSFGTDGLAACLAEYIGGDLSNDTRRQAARFRSALAMRWGDERAVSEAVFY